jgi:hypothetical protein
MDHLGSHYAGRPGVDTATAGGRAMADSSQKVDLTKQARAKLKDSSVRSGPTMGALMEVR